MAKKSKQPGGKISAKPGRPIPSAGELPSKEQILEFVRSSPEKVGKREIARAFNITGGARIGLKRLLNELTAEGALSGNRRELKPKGGLPPVCVLDIIGRDDDGDLIAEPVVWDADDGERPKVLVLTRHGRETPHDIDCGVGDRVLANITTLTDADVEGFRFEASPIKKLEREKRRLLGIFRAAKGGKGGTIEPIDRKELRSWSVQPGDEEGAKDGDLVRYDLPRKGRLHVPRARVLESLGNPDDERKISLIAVHAHGIPDDFPGGVIAEAEALAEATLGKRQDLRQVPLLTIDPPDARDHDDAVHAEPDPDPRNHGGHIVIVAIADVAHYIRPNSRLDREAALRGNSVYFPDRVVPMLPERISNDLCSLREGQDRPCLAVRMVFDRHGDKRSATFSRAMMRSAAKLSYQEAQAAIDGNVSETCAPLMARALQPLWEAYAALSAARDRRAPLDLDLPERKILLDETGRVSRIVIPERLDAHRLIEEMMIQANVAAAEALEGKKGAVVYRIHDAPSPEKLKALREFLETLDLKVPPLGTLKPRAFNQILEQAKDLPIPDLVNEVVLRAQSQAEYNPKNIGHFGLNLAKYAHFTSPIRRYADLLVHRALIATLRLGEGGLGEDETPRLAAIAKAISEAERRAMAAERETTDRLIAAHLSAHVGATFNARIGGVTRSGLFVRLKDTGADGFVPISTLGQDYFQHIEAARALVGSRTGETYRLGDEVEVKLVEAIPSAGALRFEMLTRGPKNVKLKTTPGAFKGRGLRNRRYGPPRR